jgi:2-dehydro-3-deoxyphosphogluconate aldolase/(4S)-4-hydroxy-2-oxoglutarate aldolase
LKAISEPYQHVRFLPTGGINADNLKDYLELPQVLACGGSWMVKKELINAGEFNAITLLIKEAMKLVAEVRS